MLTLLVVAALAIAGCGSTDDDGSKGDPKGGSKGAAAKDEGSSVEGVDSMELMYISKDTGPAMFTWDEVDGAATYRVALLDGKNQPVWSWAGEGRSTAPRPHVPIPEDATATVAALGEDGTPLALSEPIDVPRPKKAPAA